MNNAERPDAPAQDPAGRGAEVGHHDRPAGDAEHEDADLAASLSEPSSLSAGRFGLVELLTNVATMAVQAIPGADGAGLTLLEPDRADVIVKSTEFVRQIDEIQYSIGQGPCISAAASGTTMIRLVGW